MSFFWECGCVWNWNQTEWEEFLDGIIVEALTRLIYILCVCVYFTSASMLWITLKWIRFSIVACGCGRKEEWTRLHLLYHWKSSKIEALFLIPSTLDIAHVFSYGHFFFSPLSIPKSDESFQRKKNKSRTHN